MSLLLVNCGIFIKWNILERFQLYIMIELGKYRFPYVHFFKTTYLKPLENAKIRNKNSNTTQENIKRDTRIF